jgi:hypothetical protein
MRMDVSRDIVRTEPLGDVDDLIFCCEPEWTVSNR